MSRTSKFTLAVTLAFSAIGFQAQAQEKTDAAMLAAIMQSMSGDAHAGGGDLRSEIEARIRDIMKEVESKPASGNGKSLSIEEIDAMNRMAERERTELEFETARYERMELELQRLMTFYAAVKTIEEDKQAEQSAARARIAEMMPDTTVKADPKIAQVDQDQKLLPRIDSITGIGGVFTAQADFNGETVVTLRPGSRVLNGFLVEDIQSSHVMLRGPSSQQLFRIVPQSPPAPMQPDSPVGPGGVIDLSKFPMAQF